MINIFFDGGTALNSVCFYDENRDFYDIQKIDLIMTNNQLEYTALYKAIQYVNNTYIDKDIIFNGDSELVIMQMNGDYKVSNYKLKIIKDRLNREIDGFKNNNKNYNYKWISRNENKAGIKLEQILKGKRS